MTETVFVDVGVGTDPARTAVPAVLFAWAANLDLLSSETAASAPLTRLKMRDIAFNDAFVATCHGKLGSNHLRPTLAAWLEEHYGGYQAFALNHLAGDPLDPRHPWATYDALAPWLTERWLGRSPTSGSLLTRLLRRWRS